MDGYKQNTIISEGSLEKYTVESQHYYCVCHYRLSLASSCLGSHEIWQLK